MSFLLRARLLFPVLLLIAVGGCQPKVYLMPPPVGLHSDSEFFNLSEGSRDENLLYTLYATNRAPFNRMDNSTGYTIFPSNTLEIGHVVYSVGNKDMSWEELHRESLKDKRDKELLLSQEFIREGARYSKGDDLSRASARAKGFFDQINKAIDTSFDKDITVYVHGANSNFYRATAQGAQFFHYTGQNSLILTFSWPSAENLLKYKTDVLHAKKTVPAFARLIEILATHTKAKSINILAYSAGAQVAAPGLVYLRNLHPTSSAAELKKRFRIGEVYFAAPDTDFQAFIDRYLKFRGIVGRTTINLNHNDSVLRLAAFHNGVSRLGRPDVSELNDWEEKLMIAAMETPQLNVLDISGSTALNVGGAHDSWYSHPWVSNDLLLLLLFNDPPEERGLVAHHNSRGVKRYIFPDDYDQIIRKLILAHKTEILNRQATEQEGVGHEQRAE